MLQGHPSQFWAHLYDGLRADGHVVKKINLCLADQVYWGGRPSTSYRGRYAKWRDWLRAYLVREGITDILYYADRLPYHADAHDVSKDLDIRCWAIEFGYLRPDWLTLEPDGMGALSTFPRNRADVQRMAQSTPKPDMEVRYTHDFPTEAFHEVTFNLLQTFGRPFFPLYFSDKIYWPVIDYLSWLGELARDRGRQRDAHRLQDQAVAGEIEYNLVAMQLQADYQIRASSPYTHLMDFLEEVMVSFAHHAPQHRQLLIKLHPLDNGLERWFRRVPALARKHGLSDRVKIFRGGELGVFLKHSKGVALVNSTVGIHALRAGVPTFVAGNAIFDIEGLTHQSGLDTFWSAPAAVDRTFFAEFERALGQFQVKGSFFNPEGRQAAIKTIRSKFKQPIDLRVLDDETAMPRKQRQTENEHEDAESDGVGKYHETPIINGVESPVRLPGDVHERVQNQD